MNGAELHAGDTVWSMPLQDPAVLLTLGLNSVLSQRIGVDHLHAIWEDWYGPLPMFSARIPGAADPLSAASAELPTAIGEETPSLPGLLGLMRRHGADRARLAPATLLGPYELPRVDRADRRRLGRGPALVLQRGRRALAVLADLGGETFEALACAPVTHAPMVAGNVSEAGRALREAVLAALEGLGAGDASFEDDLREWQARAAGPARPDPGVPAELFSDAMHHRLFDLALLLRSALDPMNAELLRPESPLYRLSQAASAALVVSASRPG